jgi:hypothetical protein
MYSTKRISSQLLEEIKGALQSVNFGSIEIFISDSNVTQITTRTIKKTTTLEDKPKKTSVHTNGKSKKYIMGSLVTFNSNER